MKLAKQRPEYFNVEELGVPINDLDCLATIVSFSASLIWVGFPRQGIWMRDQETKDYVALWRYVAYLVGCPDDNKIFSSPLRSKNFMESLLLFEIEPSKTGSALANNIILSLQNRPPTYASRQFLESSTRWLNGNELADALGIGRPNILYSALVAGQCIFFMGLCYTYRSFPYLDAKKIKKLRALFYQVIVENKTSGLGVETTFDFKYIPDFHTNTSQGEIEDSTGWKTVAIQRRNLTSLVIACGVLAFMGWVSFAGVRYSLQTVQSLF
jgi:hypothetical protein